MVTFLIPFLLDSCQLMFHHAVMNKIKKSKKPSEKARSLVDAAKDMREMAFSIIRKRNNYRRIAVEQLISEGFTYREIGRLLGVTGQMVGKLVQYWEKRG